jgi:hypothetical protein
MNKLTQWLKDRAPDQVHDTVVIGHNLMGVNIGTKNVIIIPSFRGVAIISDSYHGYSNQTKKNGTSKVGSAALTS